MKHKHYDLILAWADGAKIQYRCKGFEDWRDCAGRPAWDEHVEYRIKPADPEDLVVTSIADLVDLSQWDDIEAAHYRADEILCDLLVSLGYDEIVKAYNKITKWYS